MSYSKRWFEDEEDVHGGRTPEQVREQALIRVGLGNVRRALYKASPVCQVCNESIKSEFEATVFKSKDGSDILLHDSTACYKRVIKQSMDRYSESEGRGRPRRVVVARNNSFGRDYLDEDIDDM